MKENKVNKKTSTWKEDILKILILPVAFTTLFSIMMFILALIDNEEPTIVKKLILATSVMFILGLSAFTITTIIALLIYIISKLFQSDYSKKEFLNLFKLFKSFSIKQKNFSDEEIADIDSLTDQVREILRNTRKSYIQVIPDKETILGLTESKFGGNPYWPEEKRYPRDKKGIPLQLLAQFNLSDLPENDYLPQKGILQFFILGNDTYGLNFSSHKDDEGNIGSSTAQVIYHKEIINDKSKLITDFSFVPKPKYFPVNSETSLFFINEEEAMSSSDYRTDEKVHKLQKLLDYNEKLMKEYLGENLYSNGSKIGGYPTFTQWDPRASTRIVEEVEGKHTIQYYNASEEPYELLFQMDSEGSIMWGDSGVANFFIKPSDLKKMDFSNVLYNWDCC